MVLSIMRKHAKSWLIKVLIGIIAVVFVFYFGYSFTSKQAMKIAYVNSEVISGPEYEKVYRDMIAAYQARYKDLWSENLIKTLNLKTQALNSLIDRRLMTQAAKRLGIEVTGSECQKAIMSYPAFQVNGQFDMGRYQALLGHNHMSPEDFEASLTQELLEKKLQQFLFALLTVTEKEVWEQYRFANEKIKLALVEFRPEDFRKSVKVDEAGLTAYFESNREKYRVPAKRRVAYLEIDPASFEPDVKVTEKEIESFYEYNIAAYSHPKEVKARHILFKVDPKASKETDEEVRKKAEGILARVRKGEDFAKLAAQYSDCPSKSKGGDLGYFAKGQMVPAFEEAAFNLKKGEIGELVKTPFGYHIIQVEDIKEPYTQTLDEVRDEIVKTLTRNEASDRAHEKGLTLVDQMPYDILLSTYAKQQGLEARESSFFSRTEPIPEIKGSIKATEAIFALGKNETTNLMELEGKFYIFQVLEEKSSYVPELKEVAERVREDYVQHLAAQEATRTAERYLAELREGKPWDNLAKTRGLTPRETNFFSRRGPIENIGGGQQELIEEAFRLDAERPYPDKPFVNPRGVFVARWLEKQDVDESAFQKEEKMYRESLTQTKHQRLFESWLENLRKSARIEMVNPIPKES